MISSWQPQGKISGSATVTGPCKDTSPTFNSFPAPALSQVWCHNNNKHSGYSESKVWKAEDDEQGGHGPGFRSEPRCGSVQTHEMWSWLTLALVWLRFLWRGRKNSSSVAEGFHFVSQQASEFWVARGGGKKVLELKNNKKKQMQTVPHARSLERGMTRLTILRVSGLGATLWT